MINRKYLLVLVYCYNQYVFQNLTVNFNSFTRGTMCACDSQRLFIFKALICVSNTLLKAVLVHSITVYLHRLRTHGDASKDELNSLYKVISVDYFMKRQ